MRRPGNMRALALSFLAASVGGCGLSDEEFDQKVEAAAACSPGDACVVVETNTRCLCLVVVNQTHEAAIRAAAKDVDCGDVVVKCAALGNPRCEDGHCIADQVH
jgi:hypothetical protein